MVQAVGRAKKPAKRQNYKISYDLVAGLKAVAKLEDRSDTAQVERWMREGINSWKRSNPTKVNEFEKLAAQFLVDEGADHE